MGGRGGGTRLVNVYPSYLTLLSLASDSLESANVGPVESQLS